IPDSLFLDLYAGIGGIGIEALSRGSGHVTFVESNRAVLAALRQNVKISGYSSKARILGMTAERFLKSKIQENSGYDIVFMDPPYRGPEFKKVLPWLSRSDMIKTHGWVVLEHFHKTEMENSIGFLRKRRTYRYGDT